MTTTKTYRQGAVGALMDEYERAAAELVSILNEISDEEFERIRDTKTQDEDCRSIQTIMRHVIRAGYGYAGYMRTAWGKEPVLRWDESVSRGQIPGEMRTMLDYMIETLDSKWNLSDQEAMEMKMTVRWGPIFDFEQLFEHAIVHVLRHRRQIDRFLGR
ncbi:MAG TPA: DinB family protein [Candidatus Eisenbacteria bacterium]|nr:DinB family protein [Candidatus Eisenbacteria bacterium]